MRSSRIAEAAKLADAALRQIMEQGLTGRTEGSVAIALERAMEDLGAKRPSFGTRSSPPAPTARCPMPSHETSRSGPTSSS